MAAWSGRLQNLLGRVATGEPHHAAARVRAGAADIEAFDRGAVLRDAGHRADHEELVEGEVAMMPMAAGDAELPLDIDRGQQLTARDQAAQARGMALDRAD